MELRRRPYYLIGLLLSLCLFLIPLSSALAEEFIHNISINVSLQADGSAHIVEEWEVTSDQGTEWYKPLRLFDVQDLEDFQVSMNGQAFDNVGDDWDIDWDFDDKAYKYGTHGEELNWGKSQMGRNTYRLEYTVTNFIAQTTTDQMIYWQFINDSMEPAPQAFTITLNHPQEAFTVEDYRIWAFGFEGEISFNNGAIVAQSTNPDRIRDAILLIQIPEGEFPTEHVYEDRTFISFLEEAFEGSDYDINDYDPHATFADIRGKATPTDDDTVLGIIVAVMAAIGLGAAGVGIYAAAQRRKLNKYYPTFDQLKQELAGQYYRQLPADNPFLLYDELLALKQEEEMIENALTASLLTLVQTGHLEPQLIEKSGLFGSDAIDFYILKTDNLPPILQPMMDFLLKSADAENVIQHDHLRQEIEDNYQEFAEIFDYYSDAGKDYMADQGYLLEGYQDILDKKGKERSDLEKAHVIAAARDIPLLSESGFEFRDNIVKYNNYLEDFSLLNERQVADVRLFDELMVAAAMFGILEEVERQLQDLYPHYWEESVYYGVPMRYYYVYAQNLYRHYSKSDPEYSASGGGGSSSFGGGGSSFGGGGSGGGSR